MKRIISGAALAVALTLSSCTPRVEALVERDPAKLKPYYCEVIADYVRQQLAEGNRLAAEGDTAALRKFVDSDEYKLFERARLSAIQFSPDIATKEGVAMIQNDYREFVGSCRRMGVMEMPEPDDEY